MKDFFAELCKSRLGTILAVLGVAFWFFSLIGSMGSVVLRPDRSYWALGLGTILIALGIWRSRSESGHVARSEAISPSVEASGLVAVRPGLSNEELKVFLGQAQQRVRIIVPWFVDPLTVKEVLRQKLQSATFSLQVFMLDPSSPYLKRRGEVIQPAQPDYGPSEARRTLLALAEAVTGYQDRAHVYLYDSLPSAFVAQADTRVLVGFHMNAGIALKYPHLEFVISRDGVDTPLGTMVKDEFVKLAAMSREVELTSVTQAADAQLALRFKPQT